MCGIVGAVAQRDVAEILINGLHRLEYRGYDSAGVAVVDPNHELHRVRCLGKVKALDEAVAVKPLIGGTGITRVGQLMVNHLKPMLIRILQVTLLSSITASSKTTKNYVNYSNHAVMYLILKPIPK